jgi:type 1 fimbria pilin
VHYRNLFFLAAYSFSALTFCAVQARAQVSELLTINATVLVPLTINCNVALNFGSIDTSQAGDVVLGSDGMFSAGSVHTLPDITPNSGVCTIDGQDDEEISLTFTPATLTHTTDNTQTLAVSNFTIEAADHTPVSTNNYTVKLQNGGPETIAIGATLTIAGNEIPGTYTGQSTLTINYE